MSIIEKSDYESFKTSYPQLLELGIENIIIIEHVKKSRVFFFFRDDTLDKLLNFFLKSDNTKIDELICTLIENNNSNKSDYDIYRLKHKNPKLKKIDEIFNNQ